MLISAVQQSNSVIHIYTSFLIFFSIIVDARILHIVPCDIGFQSGSVVKNLPGNIGDIRESGSVPE